MDVARAPQSLSLGHQAHDAVPVSTRSSVATVPESHLVPDLAPMRRVRLTKKRVLTFILRINQRAHFSAHFYSTQLKVRFVMEILIINGLLC